MDLFVVLLLALGYPVVYCLEAFYRPINLAAHSGDIYHNDYYLQCTGYIHLDLAARIFFWYLPVSVAGAHIILSRWQGQSRYWLLWGLLAPHALFYGIALTVYCPADRILTHQTLALENSVIQNRSAVWNATNSFIPLAVIVLWESTIVFTALSAIWFALPHILNSIGYTQWQAAPFKSIATALRFLGATIFLSLNPTVNKLFDDPIGENCRRSLQNPERVFDTPQTVFGLITIDIQIMCGIIIATSVIAGGCQLGKSKGIGAFFELISFVTAGAFIARVLYVQSNPGCINGISAVTSGAGRAGLTILTLGWLSTTFPHILEDRPESKAAYQAFTDS